MKRILLIGALTLSALGVAFMARANDDKADEPVTYRTLDRMIKHFAAEALTRR